MRQASLFKIDPPVYGGELTLGKRKGRRTLLASELRRLSERFQLKLYDVAVNHDHLHFVAKIPNRAAYIAFIRSFTGLMARQSGKKLWRLLPFSRVAKWGKDYLQLRKYLRKSREEAGGVRTYEPRRDWYRRLRRAGDDLNKSLLLPER